MPNNTSYKNNRRVIKTRLTWYLESVEQNNAELFLIRIFYGRPTILA